MAAFFVLCSAIGIILGIIATGFTLLVLTIVCPLLVGVIWLVYRKDQFQSAITLVVFVEAVFLIVPMWIASFIVNGPPHWLVSVWHLFIK